MPKVFPAPPQSSRPRLKRRLGFALLIAVVLVSLSVERPGFDAHGQAVNPAGAGQQVVASEPQSIQPQRRLIRKFDFETANDEGIKFGQALSMPPNWHAIGRRSTITDPVFHAQPLHRSQAERPGFPAYGDVHYDSTQQSSGEFSVHLGLRGGNVGAYLETGAVPALPGSDYLVHLNLRTAGLDESGAVVRVFFLDADGQVIPESTRLSPGSIRTDGIWTPVSIRLPGLYPNAAWIGLEVTLEQPTVDPESLLGTHQIVHKDISGHAWFDDVAVWQLPFVEVSVPGRVQVFRGTTQPTLQAEVRDLTGQRLRAEITLYDHQLRAVAQDQREVGAGAPSRWDWKPDLDRYGWYATDLRVYDQSLDRMIARHLGAILLLPEEPRRGGNDRTRFVLGAQGLSPSLESLLPTLLDRTRLSGVVVSLWEPGTTLNNLERRLNRLEHELLRPVLSRQGLLTLSLLPLPDDLANELPGQEQDVLALWSRAPERLWAYLRPALIRTGQGVNLWQLGEPGTKPAGFRRDWNRQAQAMAERLRLLVPNPTMVLPWSLDWSRPQSTGDVIGYDVLWPNGLTASNLPEAIGPWVDPPARFRLVLDTPGADRLPHQRRIQDAMIRSLVAWENNAGGVILPEPFGQADRRELSLLPDPLLGVFANLCNRLAGRRSLGRMYLGTGLECMIFHGPHGGVLAMWNDSAEEDEVRLAMDLGGSPVRIDPFGNASPLDPVDGKHPLVVSRTPVFLEGIDTNLARFRAGFRMDDPFLPATQRPHERTVTLTNPWPRTITGNVTFAEPAGWRITPRRKFFSIPAGGQVEFPITLTFPFRQEAGDLTLDGRFEIQADRRMRIIAKAPLEIGLEGIDFQATVTAEPGRQAGQTDGVVSCVVTNTGTEPRSVFVFANLREHARQERIISGLQPGESVIRRFRFTDAAESLSQYPVRTGVREISGPAVLNKIIRPETLRP